MLKVTLFSLLIILVPQLCLASEGLGFAKKLGSTILNSPEELWVGVKSKNLKFVVREPSDGHAIFVNFSDGELKPLAQSILKSEGIIKESTVVLPPIDFFAGCDSNRCGDNQDASTQEKLSPMKALAKTMTAPWMIVNPFLPDDWLKGMTSMGVNTADALIFIFFHEAFHQYQDGVFTNTLLPTTLPDETNCKTDPTQKTLFRTALEMWNHFLVQSYKAPDQTKSLLKDLLRFYDGQTSPCLDTSSYRPEGTANYFAFQTLKQSKTIPLERLIQLVNLLWLNLKMFDESTGSSFDPDNRYGIGYSIYYALSLIDPTLQWQKRTNLGEAPLSTLRSLMEALK